MTVLKQEIPSPFGSDQVKKIVKSSALNKEQVDEISQIDQVTIKNGNLTSTNAGNTNTNIAGAVAVATTAVGTIAACHLNGNSNSNSSASNELANCLENVAAAQHQSNDQNDERNESTSLSMCDFLDCKISYLIKSYCAIVFVYLELGHMKDDRSAEESR